MCVLGIFNFNTRILNVYDKYIQYMYTFNIGKILVVYMDMNFFNLSCTPILQGWYLLPNVLDIYVLMPYLHNTSILNTPYIVD